MSRRLILIIISLWLAVTQAGWVSLLPTTTPLVVLPLSLVAFLVMEFRRGDALLVAVTAGLALDTVSSLPAGLNTVLLITGYLVADFLFQRVFTNQSLLAAGGLHASVYLGYLVSLSAVKLVRATLYGWSWAAVGVWPAWPLVIIGMASQATVIVLFLLGRRFV